MSALIQLRQITSVFPVAFALGSFAFCPMVQGVEPAAPDTALANGNTADGQGALASLTTGFYNSAFGIYSLLSNTDASFNTGVGAGTLLLSTGEQNTATGAGALLSNTAGDSNTADGAFSLFNNTTGYENTASGHSALVTNLDGFDNTANGHNALYRNDHGSSNTAIGASALYSNQGGYQNTAIGVQALFSNTTGLANTAVGDGSLGSNTSGGANTAIGWGALSGNGHDNTAIGWNALGGNSTGSINIALGSGAGYNTTGYNNIDIGNSGQSGENDTIRIGDSQATTYIAGITGATVTGASVVVNGGGQLGVAPSSARFKDDIKSMDKASELLLALKPVTFHYKKEIDPTGTAQFGLVAEEVEKVHPDLVVRDKEGKPYSVRYDAVNAMLLNEFLKEHRKNEEQQATIAQLKSGMEALTATVKEQAEQIQKVSAQLDASKLTPQMVADER